MATISLCMVVCNEIKNIRRCLKSVRRMADEIVVIDTGSTDRTKAVCEEFGARVFDFWWAEDFSEARNYSISKASCDWILLLDADEELEIRDPNGLKQYLSDTANDRVSLCMTHFYGEKPADKTRAYFSGAPRLIRNNGAVHFIGKIHEKFDAAGQYSAGAAETRQFVRVLHYGYMQDVAESKTSRNLAMLLPEKDKQPGDPWISYCLAVEYHRSGRPADAFLEVNTAIALFIGRNEKPPSLTYKLKYDILVTSGRHDLAYSGIGKAIQLYPNYVDLHFYKGILQYNRGEYDLAGNTFLYCLLLGEVNADYLILSGSGSFLAMYYLGLCHEKQGEPEQAAEAFRQAKALCPSLDSVRHRFEKPDEEKEHGQFPLHKEQ